MQLNLIKNCSLFLGFTENELEALFEMLDPIERSYIKGETVMAEGDTNYYFRILLSGSAFASKSALDGGDEAYTTLAPGDVFGGVIAVSGGMPSEVTVTAAENSKCLLIDYRKVASKELSGHPLQTKLMANITKELAQKYFALRARIDCITCPTLRDKIMTYLKINTRHSAGDMVYVPLNREQLAAYLNADRASLCRELSRMRDDGLIEYYKNSFRLLI